MRKPVKLQQVLSNPALFTPPTYLINKSITSDFQEKKTETPELLFDE
jgi:hypothetical protein